MSVTVFNPRIDDAAVENRVTAPAVTALEASNSVQAFTAQTPVSVNESGAPKKSLLPLKAVR